MLRVPPPLLALLALGVQRAITPGGRRATPLRAAAAGMVALSSASLAAAAASRFRRSGTTLEPLHPDRASTLVTTGANQITRNPMYVGLAGLLVANAIRRGSWLALLPAGGFVVVVDRTQIGFEEAALRERFGAEYAAYLESVPRWLDARSVRRKRAS